MSQPAPIQNSDTPKCLWQPKNGGEDSRLYEFMAHVTAETGYSFNSYEAIHQWSVEHSEEFWSFVWDFFGIAGDKIGSVAAEIERTPWLRFFPEATINYAENCLRFAKEKADQPAIIGRTQDQDDKVLTWAQLYDQVSRWRRVLGQNGLSQGDAVGVYLPNIPESVVIFLAAASLGIVFCSSGMEMGGDDLINRFAQVKPKLVISQDTYTHGAKQISREDVLSRIEAELDGTKLRKLSDLQIACDALEPEAIEFERFTFNMPLYILFSSGTTGLPKGFVHSAGGVLLKHLSEYGLNSDVREDDVVFFHATPSWMMWNWLVSGLAVGATILMYDGSPAYPDALAQWRFCETYRCTHHGSAAPLILSWRDAGASPKGVCDLSSLRVIFSTGAVLPAAGFEYIHDHIKEDVKISSISGGTDIVGCFVGGNPLMATYAGQINGPMLGVEVDVWTEEGKPAGVEEPGELVCLNAFPSMPLEFRNDLKGEKYKQQYFSHFAHIHPRVWHHGDAIMRTAQGQLKIIGRSDATLNQNGVRIGASTIYKQLEAFKEQIADAAAVDFKRPDNEQAVTVLFLELKDGCALSDELLGGIRNAIKQNVTPYAIPGEVFAAPNILKTPNGKKAEVVIKKIINGSSIPNPSLYGQEFVAFYEEIGQNLRDKYS